MIRVKTEASVYELHFTTGEGGIPLGGMIRYVEGDGPTESLAPAGVWREFHAVSMLKLGRRLQIVWPAGAVHAGTITSNVMSIEEI